MSTGVTNERASAREAALRRELGGTRALLSLLRRQAVSAAQEHCLLAAEVERLRVEGDQLRKRNEGLARAAKRQAAPLRRKSGEADGEVKRPRKRAGRKPGADYGSKAHRHRPEHGVWWLILRSYRDLNSAKFDVNSRWRNACRGGSTAMSGRR